jgi:hypothetical protein
LTAIRRVQDGATCYITRTGPRGSHTLVFPPGTIARGSIVGRYRAVRAILSEILELPDREAPAD